MEQTKKKFPIGYDNFEKLRRNDCYYVDKTCLIKEILDDRADVTLFTRPRRFGKTLNMSMLANFFSVDGDKSIFNGLDISKETDICERHMGKYPVVFLSLKDIDALDYDTAFQTAVSIIMNTAGRAKKYLNESAALDEQDKKNFHSLLSRDMTEGTLRDSLRMLCSLLEKHFGKKAVLLIDEYDVPLAKAHAGGYYDQMVSLIRGLLGAALKTNDSLEFAVLTGCLRIAKESIFTGLNSLKTYSITSASYSEYFGFTQREVREMLEYYGMGDAFNAVRDWYDGYSFGGTDIYCPWDVINYCHDKHKTPDMAPENYWINTSGNDIIRRFAEMADLETREEIERLVAGDAIEKEIHEELTYSEMYKTIDNVWSVLYMTGYLTQRGKPDGRRLRLAIPNAEVRDVYVTQIKEYFDDAVRADADTLTRFCSALRDGDAETAEDVLSGYLERSISVRDYAVPKNRKESFYHGLLLGILNANGRWIVKSNPEGGGGYPDIVARPEDRRTGIVIELKYADGGDLEGACQDALDQIERLGYAEAFRGTRVKTIRKYGIGCYKKECMVMMADGD